MSNDVNVSFYSDFVNLDRNCNPEWSVTERPVFEGETYDWSPEYEKLSDLS